MTFHIISNAETRLQHSYYEVPLIPRACHVGDRKLHQLYCHVWKRRQRQQQVRNKQLAELREWAITPSQNRYVSLLYFSAQWQTHREKWTKVTFGSWESIPHYVSFTAWSVWCNPDSTLWERSVVFRIHQMIVNCIARWRPRWNVFTLRCARRSSISVHLHNFCLAGVKISWVGFGFHA